MTTIVVSWSGVLSSGSTDGRPPRMVTDIVARVGFTLLSFFSYTFRSCSSIPCEFGVRGGVGGLVSVVGWVEAWVVVVLGV